MHKYHLLPRTFSTWYGRGFSWPKFFLTTKFNTSWAIKFPQRYYCRDVNDLVVLCLSHVNCARKTLHLIAEDDDGDCRECVESVSFSLVELRLSLQNSLLGLMTLDLSVDHWKGIYVSWRFFQGFFKTTHVYTFRYISRTSSVTGDPVDLARSSRPLHGIEGPKKRKKVC